MNVNDLLSEPLINLQLSAKTKEELFNEMAIMFKSEGICRDKEVFIQDLKKREEEYSTGIGSGFAIPHAKSLNVLKPAIAFGRSSGISDYETLDDSIVRWIFMIAVPEGDNDEHLRIISSLARKMMDADFKEKIQKASTKLEIIEALI